MKKAVSGIMLTLLLTSILMLAFNIKQAESSEPPATEWSRTYGGASRDRAHSVVQTSDGGYVIAGYTLSFDHGADDFWLIKTNSTGDMKWNKTYGGAGDDRAGSAIQTEDGGYAIVGETNSFGAGGWDSWLIKTDQAGNMEWNQTYGGAGSDNAFSVVQTDDGGYIVAGYTTSFGAGGFDFWLIKTDSTGDMEWNQTYGGAGEEKLWSVVQTVDDGYAMAGYTWSFGAGGRDCWLVKTDSSGGMEWNQTYGETSHDEGISVVQTYSGEYAIAGYTASFGAGDRDIWLIKTDVAGNMQWNRTYGGTNWDEAESFVQTDGGGYALAGSTESFGAGVRDFWLVRTDSSGNEQWNQTYGGAGDDRAFSVVQTDDGGYAMAGRTTSFGAGDADFWLIKLAPEEIPAVVEIKPETLNLKSKGQWITCYIELPEGYDVNDINITTVMLNDTVSAEIDPTEVGDHDGDGVPDLMVKFSRAEVIQLILSSIDPSEFEHQKSPYFIERILTVTGQLYDGTPFEGNDTIRVIFKYAIII